jgi:hypothetical protein
MAWRTKDDLGTSIVGYLHDQLKISDKYLMDVGRGFTWWPSDFAQTVISDDGIFHNASTVYRLHIETDLVKANGHENQLIPIIANYMSGVTNLSAVTYEPNSDLFRLHTSVYACYENEEWLKRLLLAALALQTSEAKRHVQMLTQTKGVQSAQSAHPAAGMRNQPDPVVNLEQQFLRPAGSQPSRWIDSPEWSLAAEGVRRLASKYSTDQRANLEGEYELSRGGSPMRFSVSAEEPHRLLGNGLNCLLSVPLALEDDHRAVVAWELNELERRQWNWCHDVGSWCVRGQVLAFECFVPNISFAPQLLPDMAHDIAMRAKWFDEQYSEGRLESLPTMQSAAE